MDHFWPMPFIKGYRERGEKALRGRRERERGREGERERDGGMGGGGQ